MHSADAAVQAMDGIGTGALAKMIESGKNVTPDVWKTLVNGMDVNKSYDMLNGALDTLEQSRSANYLSGMSKIKGADVPVDFWDVDAGIRKAIGDTHYKAPGDTSPGPGIPKIRDPGVQAGLATAQKIVDQWRNADPVYHTAMGFDSMKQSLAEIARGLEGPHGSATPGSVAVNNIVGAVRKTITDQVPEYAKVMNKYGEESDFIKGVRKEFSVAQDDSSKFTAIRKLQKVYRQTADVMHGARTDLLNEALEGTGQQNLMNHLAADQFHPPFPRGIRGTMLPFAVMHSGLTAGTALPFVSSPRLAGTAAYGAGRAAGIADRAGVTGTAGAATDLANRGLGATMRIQNQMPPDRRARGGFLAGYRRSQ
jgi:hypothetical protein